MYNKCGNMHCATVKSVISTVLRHVNLHSSYSYNPYQFILLPLVLIMFFVSQFSTLRDQIRYRNKCHDFQSFADLILYVVIEFKRV